MAKLADPSRAALAEAIAAKRDAERSLETACQAENHAFDRLIAARSALEALRNQPPDDPAQAYIKALASAHDVNVLELQRPASERAAQAQRLEQEIAGLRETREALKKATDARRQEVERAEFRVQQRAKDVVRNSTVVAGLLEGLDVMQAEVAKRRSDLRFLQIHSLIPSDLEDAVKAALFVDPSDDAMASRAAAACWSAVLEALSLSADAPLSTQGE